MKIGIIGGGISGLSAALAMSKYGHEVHVFQRERALGGLLATFDFGGIRAEHFYHFLCQDDQGVFALCRELGLSEAVHFKTASTGFYYCGKHYPFTTALDLLRFRPLTLQNRIRFGLFALAAKWRKNWQTLDAIPAKPWLLRQLTQQGYDVIWKPLLEMKFGAYHEQISAAWVWHRIHRVARSNGKLGYLEGGTAQLLDALHARLEALGVHIHCDAPVAQLNVEDGKLTGLRYGDQHNFACDRVISTVPMPILAQLLPEGYADYAAELQSISYIGVVCVLFKLARPVSKHFWLNVHDPDIPFNGVIEYSNLNPKHRDAGHLVYVPYYVDPKLPPYTDNDETVIAQSWAALQKIQPALKDADRLDVHVARTPFAQAVCPVHFLEQMPRQHAPIEGLHLLDSIFLYPEDRTQSGHILRAEALAAELEESISNTP